jgi:hypothetical protein
MDFKNARMWVVDNITITKDESSKNYPNKPTSIQKCSARKVLVALVPT